MYGESEHMKGDGSSAQHQLCKLYQQEKNTTTRWKTITVLIYYIYQVFIAKNLHLAHEMLEENCVGI